MNTGNFVVMPTPKGREFIQRMLEGLIEYVGKDTAEQIWINNKLAHQQVFQLCRNRQQCYRILDEVRPGGCAVCVYVFGGGVEVGG